jgi:hypothetical protein
MIRYSHAPELLPECAHGRILQEHPQRPPGYPEARALTLDNTTGTIVTHALDIRVS